MRSLCLRGHRDFCSYWTPKNSRTAKAVIFVNQQNASAVTGGLHGCCNTGKAAAYNDQIKMFVHSSYSKWLISFKIRLTLASTAPRSSLPSRISSVGLQDSGACS